MGLHGGVPATIGKYAVSGTLGQGTFGTVIKASHQIAGEKVAIKVLEKRKMQQADDIERVGREIQILKQLKHPHVVRLWEIIYAPDRIYLVMEFAARGELFQYIVKQGRLKEDEGRRFFNQIVNGVAYLHANNVVHRDIKPENLLLDSDKTIRIVDFGLSTKCAPGQVLKHACGSPCYAAPEMLTREGQQHGYVGHPVDIWSTGVTLFAMICGFLPFEHANTSALYKKIIAGDYAAPPFLSRDAKDVLKRLLTTDPTRRWKLDQIAAHAWCTADGAASAVVQSGGDALGAVARLSAETAPDAGTLARMEAQYGYVGSEVVSELGKHSDAAGTYWLLRLHAHKQASRGAAEAAPLSGRGGRAEWERPREQGAAPQQPQSARGPQPRADGKENHPLAESPLAPRPRKPQDDTPTKKLTRSPKPLTLLPAAYQAGGGDDTRRSSPGLFKAPAGAAHAAARHRQQQQQQQQNTDALASFRERMRGAAPAGATSARDQVNAVDDARGYYQRTARPQSARRQHAHAPGNHAPRQHQQYQQPRPPSRSVSPRHRDQAAPPQQQQQQQQQQHGVRDPSPRDYRQEAQAPPPRRGADFRSRKYAQTGNGNNTPRMVGLIAR